MEIRNAELSSACNASKEGQARGLPGLQGRHKYSTFDAVRVVGEVEVKHQPQPLAELLYRLGQLGSSWLAVPTDEQPFQYSHRRQHGRYIAP